MGKRIMLIGMACVILGVAAGCGGSDSTGTETASEALSPAAFVTEAEKICESGRSELSKRLATYQRENGKLNPSDPGVAVVAAVLLPVEKKATEQLEALGAPEEIADRYQKYLETKRANMEEIEKQKLSTNTELFEAFEDSDHMAVALQIEACSFA